MLSRYHREIAATEALAVERWDPRAKLFPAALAGFDDPARHRAWRWGRGTSKTTTGQYAHLDAAIAVPGCAVVYMSDTIGRAREVVWDELVEWAEELGGKANASHLRITFPNRARIFVTGADKIKFFNRKRGIKRISLVHLDECQDWAPEVLEYAVTKVFMPRLGDLERKHGIKGRILLSGTGTKDAGYWFRACTDPTLGYGVTHATQWDNPHIADPDGEFREACKAAGVEYVDLTEPIPSRFPGGRPRWVDCADPMTRREWFAEFNSGGALQVFRPPFTVVVRRVLPERDIQLVVCFDFGTVDAFAGAAWLWSKWDPRAYLVECAEERGLSNSSMVRLSREWAEAWRSRYKPTWRPTIVGDGGGLGKGLILDIQAAEQAWEVSASEKQDKVPNIRILAGDMRDGTAAILDDVMATGPDGRLVPFTDLLKLPEWDPNHVGERLKGHMPDAIDAAYMGYRKVKELRVLAPPPAPVLTKDQQEQADLAKERREGAQRARRTMGGRLSVDAWKR